jgi:hypothetical protein
MKPGSAGYAPSRTDWTFPAFFRTMYLCMVLWVTAALPSNIAPAKWPPLQCDVKEIKRLPSNIDLGKWPLLQCDVPAHEHRPSRLGGKRE